MILIYPPLHPSPLPHLPPLPPSHLPPHHQGGAHPEIPGYADIDQQGDLLTSFGSIDMAGLANHTSDFIGGFFGENDGELFLTRI